MTLAGRRVGVKLLYNLVHRKFNQLEIRCGRENQHTTEEALRSPLSSCSWREDAGMRTKSQRGWDPRPPVEQPRRTEKKRGYGHKSGGQYVAILLSLTPSHTQPFQIKWEEYFSKELCRSSLLCRSYDSACIWVYNTLNSEFSLPKTCCPIKTKKAQTYQLIIHRWRRTGEIVPFSRALLNNKSQIASFRI